MTPGTVTGVAIGRATIPASYQKRSATLSVSVEEDPGRVLTFAFDPRPLTTITEDDTGHFRVNIVDAGVRNRLTEGFMSSAETVVRINLEGDRWRYTGVDPSRPSRAEIRVVHGDEDRPTHNVTVERRVAEKRWRGIRVAPEAGRAGYQRPSWNRWNVQDTEIYRQDGSPACTPYTRTPINYVGVGDGLDREHIVALAEAWDSRPDSRSALFRQSTLQRIAEDHDNLTLATASANRSKGDRDAAEWRPGYNGAWMAYRIVEVKRKYNLSVDPAERYWLERLLGSGPDAITCRQTETPTADHPPVPAYRNCTAMRDAGWNRGVNWNGGTYPRTWNEAERDTYALNTGRDRDRDGHACE